MTLQELCEAILDLQEARAEELLLVGYSDEFKEIVEEDLRRYPDRANLGPSPAQRAAELAALDQRQAAGRDKCAQLRRLIESHPDGERLRLDPFVQDVMGGGNERHEKIEFMLERAAELGIA